MKKSLWRRPEDALINTLKKKMAENVRLPRIKNAHTWKSTVMPQRGEKRKDSGMGNRLSQDSKRESSHYTTLMKLIHDDIIGDGTLFESPFGKQAVLYCDYTASGRPLRCIEEYIDKYVKPFYANTHTTTCITARQTTKYRHDAKEVIRRCVNAGPDDVLIFVGSGTTAAIHKLIGVLKLREGCESNMVVFVSPFEHHSNLLPWMEAGYEVVRIKETDRGCLDLADLESKLIESGSCGKTMMASLNAASNITGIVTDTVAVAELLHKYGAYSFWDFATAAPYLPMDMNASERGYKDAVFCSPHKFVGGPGTPGLLIAKKHLFHNSVPHGTGGGTVLYVVKSKYKYLSDIEAREEGGTPAIIESIRAGLVFRLKKCVGQENIEAREEYLYQRAKTKWTTSCSNMVILGCGSVKRLPIFSFLVWSPIGKKYLHHNFVSALLNDLFGIQTRGGCACAGPYAEGLLGINGEKYVVFLEKNISMIDSCTVNGCTLNYSIEDHKDHEDHREQRSLEIMKPGFVRLNFPYFMTDDECEFVIKAVAMVAEHGWRLLPQYTMNPQTGEWQHRNFELRTHSLNDVTFTGRGIAAMNHTKVNGIRLSAKIHERTLLQAERLILLSDECAKNIDFKNDPRMADLIGQDKTDYIWFLEPQEAAVSAAVSKFCPSVDFNRNKTVQYFHPRNMSKKISSTRLCSRKSLKVKDDLKTRGSDGFTDK